MWAVVSKFAVRWIIQPIVTLIFARAILIAANTSGFSPDQWLADIILTAPTALELEGVTWGLAAIVGGLIWYYADYFLYRRNRQSETTLGSNPQPVAHPGAPKADVPVVAEPQGPIEWYFNDKPTIFGWNDANDGTFLVGTLNIRGRNISDEPIVNVEAYVRPQVTTKDITLRFYHPREHNLLDTENYMIQPDAEFQLSYKFPPYDTDKTPQGVPIDRFLSEYGGIRFVFVYDDGVNITHDFPYEKIRAYLFEKLDEHTRRRSPPPDIRKI
jgi:hypothetical protein